MRSAILLAVFLVAGVAQAEDQPTMADLQARFAEKIIALAQASRTAEFGPGEIGQEMLKLSWSRKIASSDLT